MYDHVVSGLIRRRRELSGELIETTARAKTLTTDLEALDKVLVMFAPYASPEDIPALQSRPQADWAGKGEVSRAVLSILRQADGPMATLTIAAELNRHRGIEGDPTALHSKRLRKCLQRQRTKGVVQSLWVHGVLCWLVDEGQPLKCTEAPLNRASERPF